MKVSHNVMATVGGALAGAIAGFLFLTEDGRAFRRRLERTLEDANHELSTIRRTMGEATSVASEGRQLLNEVISDSVTQPLRYPNPRQTSPF